jgi:hypothetical protein
MYQVPPAPVQPKKRYLRVDDPAEVAAIMLPGLRRGFIYLTPLTWVRE